MPDSLKAASFKAALARFRRSHEFWLLAVILAIVVLNAALGYSQEYRAEQSMAALKRMSAPTVRVRREHQIGESESHRVRSS